MIRIIPVLLFLLTCFSSSAVAGEINRYWHVTEVSNMRINGSTNVNVFQCGSVSYSGADMIRERWDPDREKWEISGSVYVDIDRFDCNNRVMNNDFRNTLNYTEYPEIKIEFMNLREVQSAGLSRKAVGWIEITLAGKTHSYYLISELEIVDSQYSVLRGEQIFKFSHFGIDPPQKGFGLVKVDDSVKVNFEFVLKRTDFADSY